MPEEGSTRSASDTSLAKALAGIRADFVNGLFPLIIEMEHRRQTLEASTEDASQALECLQRFAHKLSGIAGSVGFPVLGDHASRLEITISGLRDRNLEQSDIATLQSQLEELLCHMEDVLDENA